MKNHKTIGLIGGMSWESTTDYYRLLNQGVREQLGGLHSAKILMHSVDFAPIEELQMADNWAVAGVILNEAAKGLVAAGADMIVIGSNTMHKISDQIMADVDLPLIHIADATAQALKVDGISKVGLLGTVYTMEQDFYKGLLESRHSLEVLVPGETNRAEVNRVIFEELVVGKILDSSRQSYLAAIDELATRGAEGVILGCTEIAKLVNQDHTSVKLYDTTELHCRAVVDFAVN